MTRMIPSTIHSSVRSGAERRIFKVIQDDPDTDRWICLHSLGLAEHDSKRRGEIDFFLLCPLGLYVLEVKGGGVRREGGVWIQTDRFGKAHLKNESPFDQASSAMFAIERHLRAKVGDGAVGHALFGFGVLFPDIQFDHAGADVDSDVVYDVRDRHRPFSAYIERLAAYAKKRFRRPHRLLTHDQIREIADYLRGDFDLLPEVHDVLSDTKDQLAKLTREQFAVLDVADRDDRLIIDGPAGSGKTVLAMEAARRDARNGRGVLLLCYNRLLAAYMRNRLANEKYSGEIVASTVHAYFRALIEKSSLAGEFRAVSAVLDETTLFNETFPEFAAMAAMETAEAPIDTLVIDEAQDVLSEAAIDALSEVVRGGLREGRWRMFLDANNQASVYGRMEEGVLARIRGLSHRELLLTLNCRNTRPIALQTNVVANPERRAVGRIEGEPVEFTSYETERQSLGKLENILNQLRAAGYKHGHITVLFPRSPNEEVEQRLGKLGIRKLSEADVPKLGTDQLEYATWVPVSGFKGLENDVIVLVGIHDIESAWSRAVTYVGMSRARVRLFVICHVDSEAIRRRRFEEEVKRRMEAGEPLQ